MSALVPVGGTGVQRRSTRLAAGSAEKLSGVAGAVRSSGVTVVAIARALPAPSMAKTAYE